MSKPVKRRRIRRSKNSKKYFTKEHENGIIKYNNPNTTFEQKEKIYTELLQPAFDQMVDKIVFTYKFTNLPNIDILRQECKTWLVTVLCKFKAFSYFSVITKNWFIQKVKKNKKQNQREIEIDELSKELELKHISV